METITMNREKVVKVCELAVHNIIIDREASVVARKLKEAIDSYEANNRMPNSASVVDYNFKKAIGEALATTQGKDVKTPIVVNVINTSSTVSYQVKIDAAFNKVIGNVTFYTIFANFYNYKEI
jgi:hypothetical protein